MRKLKKKWLSRALACALAVALTAGTAVMTPVADIVGTNITAHASENIIAQGSYWKLTDDDEDNNYKLTFFGTIPDSGAIEAEAVDIYAEAEAGGSAPSLAELIKASWYFATNYVTEVTIEEDTKTSADASYLFSDFYNVTSMDLSNLDTSDATDMSGMFYYCENLKTIIVGNGWKTNSVTDSDYMFAGCTALVGGQGTTYDSTKTDKTYARIDGGPASATPGYFTKGHAPLTYTVTWQNTDGTLLEKDENITKNTTPSYDGTTPSKTGENGIKYVFTGWSDGTKTYAPDALPAVTGDVTYTAVFEEYDKDIAQNVGYYVGDKINFGDTYIKDYIWQNAKTYHISGVYTLVSAVYDSDNHYYKATLQSRNETIQLITGGYSDMGEQIAFVASSGVGTSSQPYQFQMKKYGTVIWKDEDGNVVETDEKVLDDTRPSYDGEALTKESEEPDKYHYVLRWSKDNTNAPYEYDQLFDVSFRDTDTVTYNAVFLKAQYVAENGVYFIGDTIDFNGKYVKMQDSGSVGVANFIRTIQNIQLYDASTGEYQVALHQSRGIGYYYFTVGENYGSKVAYVVKSGTGTQDDPYIMGVAPYNTITWKNGDTTLETDRFVGTITPEYNGETPEKDSDEDYAYVFKGWTSDGGTTVYTAENLPAVGGNVTYTAVYDALPIIYSDDVFVNSTESTPEVVVTDPFTKEILTAGTDYTLEISEDTVKITGIGSYAGEVQKSYTTLSREVKASITNRRKIGNNAKVVLSSEWYLPKNATNIKAGIARLSTDDTNITKYDVYNNGVKKASTLKTTSGKYSFSLLMNSTNATKNLYAVTYVTFELDDKKFASISKVCTSYPNPVA